MTIPSQSIETNTTLDQKKTLSLPKGCKRKQNLTKTSLKDVVPPSGSCEQTDNLIGNGGSTAYALAFLGVLGTTKLKVVTSLLNAEILHVWLKNQQQPLSFFGIENQRWHPDVVRAALETFHGKGNFTFQKREKNTINCFEKGKSYLIDGVLNKRYFNTIEWKWFKQDNMKTFNPTNPEWRYSVAVFTNNYVPLSKTAPTHTIGCTKMHGYDCVDFLHLEYIDPHNKKKGLEPNKEKGFLYSILDVYEIEAPNMNKFTVSENVISGQNSDKNLGGKFNKIDNNSLDEKHNSEPEATCEEKNQIRDGGGAQTVVVGSKKQEEENEENLPQEIDIVMDSDDEDQLYDGEDDRDKIPWKHTRQMQDRVRQEPIFYDHDGSRLEEYSELECRFVVTSNGTVLSQEHPQLYCIAFLNQKNQEEYAPGSINTFVIDKQRNNEVLADIRWLRTNKKYQQSLIRGGAEGSLQSPELFQSSRNSMVLPTIWAPTYLLPKKIQSKLMPNYDQTLGFFNTKFIFGLGTYSLETFTRLKPGQVADMFNLLEFYHVKDKWLWRTHLGTYIYNNFIQCALMFGFKKRDDIVHAALKSKVELGNINSQQKIDGFAGSCQACDKAHVIQHRFVFADFVLHTGCVCARRIQYLLQIGSILHEFRDAKNFSPDVAVCLIPGMQEQKMQLAADEIKFQDKFQH